jgi:hypothetical protein
VNIEALIKVYQEAQQRLINLIAYKEARGNVTAYQQSLLRQVNDELARLDRIAVQWARADISTAYQHGVVDTVDNLARMGIQASGYEAFSRLHKASVELLTYNAASMLIEAHKFVGRQMQDAIRQAGLEAIAQKQATGATVKEASRLVKDKLLRQGINGIRDKRGRMISLDAYADTVARSTTREATNTATMNQLTYNGYDLVKMSSHATTCPVCAVYQGRVYSISGLTPGYPKLSIAFSGGHANIHPRCRHVIAPYIVGLADDAEGDRVFSNRPFNIDNRSKTAIEAYNQDQAEKRRLRLDRDQWERYKLALGDDAPKTLSGFRRMKGANSERWQQLQSDYREFTRQ